MKNQIGQQTLNSSGVGDISGNLNISRNTVLFELKKTLAEVNPYFTERSDSTSVGIEVEIGTDAEADELWSYVGNKKNQRWTWYAIERNTGVILAWRNGRRTDKSCSLLMEKLSVFPVTRYYTDDWQRYRKYIPSERHIIGKADVEKF